MLEWLLNPPGLHSLSGPAHLLFDRSASHLVLHNARSHFLLAGTTASDVTAISKTARGF